MSWCGAQREHREGSLLQNLNLQMARAEFGEHGQQGLDQLLSVFSDEGDQVQPCATATLSDSDPLPAFVLHLAPPRRPVKSTATYANCAGQGRPRHCWVLLSVELCL